MIEHPMTLLDTPKLVGYPPAPSNGGALQGAPPKVGAWSWEPKFDDRRVVIHTPTGTIWNQYGELSIGHREREKFADALARLRKCDFEWIDGGLMEYRHDMMRGSVIVFDNMDIERPYYYRRAALQVEFEQFPLDNLPERLAVGTIVAGVYLTPRSNSRDPLELEGWLKAINAKIGRKFFEGQVAKREDSRYPLGFKPKAVTPLWVKHRFDQ
jgi:hypothetical protein